MNVSDCAITHGCRIKANHRVRDEFAGCSTGSPNGPNGTNRTGYYTCKGRAVNAFDARLQTYDLCLDRSDTFDFSGDDGRKQIDVCDEDGHVVGCAIFYWHRMPSGNYEFIGYLA